MSDKNSVNFTRREFLGTVAAAAAFTIVPRSVLGGPGYTAPSDMVNLAGIGVGSQGPQEGQLVPHGPHVVHVGHHRRSPCHNDQG